MIQHILLALTLSFGQANSPPSDPPSPTNDEPKKSDGKDDDSNNSDSKAPERFFLMNALEGTWVRSCLECRKIQILGWTDMSFTASSAGQNQLPLGFNYRANEFLLQQNWLRIERAVNTDAKEASFGFRSDTI